MNILKLSQPIAQDTDTSRQIAVEEVRPATRVQLQSINYDEGYYVFALVDDNGRVVGEAGRTAMARGEVSELNALVDIEESLKAEGP